LSAADTGFDSFGVAVPFGAPAPTLPATGAGTAAEADAVAETEGAADTTAGA
jgi:hypothetical protein